MQIPKIIHQVWEGKTTPLPDFLCKLGKSWRDKNPDWEYVYWDKARMDSFVHEYYPFIWIFIINSHMMLCVGM